MSEPQPIQLNIEAQAAYLSGVQILSDEEQFGFLMVSGNFAKQYFCSPKHAKRILLLLEKQISAYEEKFGELKTNLPEGKEKTSEDQKFGF